MENIRLRFYKDCDGKWYSDIPGVPKEANEMVLGTEFVLDDMADGRKELILTLTTEEPKQYQLKMSIKEHDDEGAWYNIMGPFFNQMMGKMYSQVDETKLSEGDKDMWREAFNEVWICNMTHIVFGEHPEYIYVTKIE